MSEHLVRQIKNPELATDNTLHVVSMISNPVRFNSRLRLFRDFMAEMNATKNVKLYVVEVAFGDCQFEVTERGNPQHLQLKANQEIWHKENALNLGVKRLFPRNWNYMAWLDGDISFRNPGWALETIHQLQHYPVVQPWSDCVDLGPKGEILQHFQGFGYIHRIGVPKQTHPSQPYKYAHSGFAWACTRYFWENINGLMDFCILGSADHHMAFSLIGQVDRTIHHATTQPFKNRCLAWQKNACKITHGNDVGFVKGRIEHAFHGKKVNRKYRERWQIQIDSEYDPDADIAYDSQGLIYVLNKPKLLSDLRDYFRARQEDATEAY
jgi:hypothetical protein